MPSSRRLERSDDDQALVAVGDEHVAVERVDLLLLVLRELALLRVDGVVRSVARPPWRSSSPRRAAGRAANGRGDDALAEALVVDVGHVVDAEAVLARRREEVLAAELQCRARRRRGGTPRSACRPRAVVRVEVGGVGELVQVAADDRLRLVALGHRDRLEAALPSPTQA